MNDIKFKEKIKFKDGTELDVATIVKLYCKGLTSEDQLLYLTTIEQFELNPFKREAYAIKYKGGFHVVVGFEAYIRRADATGKLDTWEVDFVKEGAEHACIITIYRTDRKRPFKMKAYAREFQRENKFWEEKPRYMLQKTVEALSFRRFFASEIGGLPYTKEELDAGDMTDKVDDMIDSLHTEETEEKVDDSFSTFESLIDALRSWLKKHNISEDQFGKYLRSRGILEEGLFIPNLPDSTMKDIIAKGNHVAKRFRVWERENNANNTD